jgi:hypothetical protein
MKALEFNGTKAVVAFVVLTAAAAWSQASPDP